MKTALAGNFLIWLVAAAGLAALEEKYVSNVLRLTSLPPKTIEARPLTLMIVALFVILCACKTSVVVTTLRRRQFKRKSRRIEPRF